MSGKRSRQAKAPSKRSLVEIRFPSQSQYLDMLHQLTRQLAQSTGFEKGESERIALAVDEATTNVLQHAYQGEPDHVIEVHFDPEGDSLDVVIYHDGEPLETVPVPEFDLDKLVAERRTGGLGLTIMRQMMDKVEHGKAATGQSMCVMVRYKHRSQGAK